MRDTIEQARDMARQAALRAGAGEAVATSLANATVAAERCGRGSVGFAHLPDYLDGLAAGRIAGTAQPDIVFPTPATIRADARGGIAQLGFDLAFDELLTRARLYGLAMFAQSNSYTAGELGYYTRRLAEAGQVALAVSNGPALMTAGANRAPVYGTNPVSFAAPVANAPPLVIDQASSATAFVNVRRAASEGATIPEGWAVDAQGLSTTDARDALHGLLLAFGGARGANIALMAEVMAAGLTGANWSLDAPSFSDGGRSPGIGLFIVAITPEVLAPDFSTRLAQQIARLSAAGVHIPGQKAMADSLELAPSLVASITSWGRT